MKLVNVRELKNNPSQALRQAREGVAVVMNRDKADVLIVHLDDDKLLGMRGCGQRSPPLCMETVI